SIDRNGIHRIKANSLRLCGACASRIDRGQKNGKGQRGERAEPRSSHRSFQAKEYESRFDLKTAAQSGQGRHYSGHDAMAQKEISASQGFRGMSSLRRRDLARFPRLASVRELTHSE